MSNPNPNPNIYIVVDQESEEDSEETEESEEDSEEEEQEESIPVMESPRVSGKDGEKGVEGRICSSLGESGENSQGKEWNRGDIDGLFCPICLEAWTTIGDHHVCCLPCGHIFGFSCICKWLQQRGTTRKCPQCNRKCTLKDVRKLFASWVVAIDGESQQIIRSLKAKCISLEKKSADLSNKDAEWRKREVEWKKREAVLQQELHQLKEKTNFLEQLLDVQSGKSGRAPSMGGYQVQSLGHSPGSEFNGQGPFILQAAAWSCSWDLNNSHQIYAGLQNGSLLVFDLRQTARPMESVNGLTSNPVHTIHSLHNSIAPSRVTAILSASSVGICQWSFGGSEERPFLLSETGYQGVCISLSYCPISDNIIASYRPRIDFPNEMASSQPLLTPLIGRGVQGSHVHLKRAGSNSYQKLGVTCANVNDIRLPRSTIMNIENHGCLFASGDELTGELVLQELPSFTVVQRLKLPKHPIHDVKYAQAFNGGLLGCLSEDILQLFRNRDLK
ncbi:E3 ubiquitin-protein ligase RFWD3 isoform X2 [Durio zibethinus]|uniref:RING-type E3 ubiquitin transferase n=1 Tax=Durio zibethinus TaxID=66656 RepID=A0A6P6AR43_DURZI|nr:E3 ubiquitin-protein ligase RFWD3 isoform X2 [Durio zibethinus]